MMDNIGELGTAARCSGMCGDIRQLPVLNLWDFLASFPSVRLT